MGSSTWHPTAARVCLTRTKLLSTIQLHTKSKNMPSSTVDTRGMNPGLFIEYSLLSLSSTLDIYDLTKHVSSDADPQYVEQLRSKMHATEQLVTAFMRAAGEVGSAVLKDEPYRRYQKSETEVRSAVSRRIPHLMFVPVCCIAVGSLTVSCQT